MLVTRAGDKHKLPYIERVRDILERDADTGSMSEDERRRLLQEETIIVEFEPERAKRALPRLLDTAQDRRVARAMLDHIEQQFALNARQAKLVTELRTLLPVPRGARALAAAPAGADRGVTPAGSAAVKRVAARSRAVKAAAATGGKRSAQRTAGVQGAADRPRGVGARRTVAAKPAARKGSKVAPGGAGTGHRRGRGKTAAPVQQGVLDLHDGD
jgi:hypothetical protein